MFLPQFMKILARISHAFKREPVKVYASGFTHSKFGFIPFEKKGCPLTHFDFSLGRSFFAARYENQPSNYFPMPSRAVRGELSQLLAERKADEVCLTRNY